MKFINIRTELSIIEKIRNLLDKKNAYDMSTLLKTGKQAPKNISKEITMDKHRYSGNLSYSAKKSLRSMKSIPENTGRIILNVNFAFPQVAIVPPQVYTCILQTL